MNGRKPHLAAALSAVILAGTASIAIADAAPHAAGESSPTKPAHGGHPSVTLLDAQGQNVLATGRPVSPGQTCAPCHNTQYIAQHNYHAWLGSEVDLLHGLEYAGRHVGGGQTAVELNCFLCHVTPSDNKRRLDELHSGRSNWSSTATLAATGLVARTDRGWKYNHDLFQPDGRITAARLGIDRSTSAHCGQCHGLTHQGPEPLQLDLSLNHWSTATTGQIFSPQRISESALNLADKERLTRSWDIHAQRLLQCADCHFSLNNPAQQQSVPASRPSHLRYEPRHQSIAEYLERPSHQLAKGCTSQGTIAGHLSGTMRRCDDCHDASMGHDWLPYRDAHFSRLSCESCHLSYVNAPAVREIDWTLPSVSGQPRVVWRGIKGPSATASGAATTNLITGFRPLLLPKRDRDGSQRLTPHNVIATWYWAEGGTNPRPVRWEVVQAALLAHGEYHPEIRNALGGPKGQGNEAGILATAEQVEAVRRRLEAAGVAQPRIVGQLQPFSLHHGVGPAREATRACETCHQRGGEIGQPFVLSGSLPGGVVPQWVSDTPAEAHGALAAENTGLVYYPNHAAAGVYILGHDRSRAVDWLGGLAVVGVVLAASVHAGLRIRSTARQSRRGQGT